MKSSLSLPVLLFCLAAVCLNAQQNTRVFPSTVTQTEPVVCVSPVNPDLIFLSGKTINTANAFISEGVYVSTNGGLTWSGRDTCAGALVENHGGSPQIVIDGNNNFLITHIGSFLPGVYSHMSTDMGKTWSAAATVTLAQPEDKGSTIRDNSPASPYYGRVYTAWVPILNPVVSFAYSSNSGQSWSAVKAINPNPPAVCSGGFLRVAADGTVYICWAGLSSNRPFPEEFIGFASSTNGGDTWKVKQNIFNIKGLAGPLPEKSSILVNGLPQMAIDKSNSIYKERIYIVTAEKDNAPAGTDPDIVLRYSTDAGQSWSGGQRVNQDQLNNGRIQYFPAIDIDSDGGVNILFYDDRATSSDSAEVWIARSVDGGNTFSERVVSEHRFKPKPIPGGKTGYQGDHISLLASGKRLHAFWMDDFSGIYQIWHKSLNADEVYVSNEHINPVAFFLHQNYPNPFNPETEIQYELGKLDSPSASAFPVSLRVLDVLGREIALLVKTQQTTGIYKVKWNASGMPSGIYFCELQAGANKQLIKMTLVR